MSWIRDILWLGGSVLILVGVWQMYAPASVVLGGTMLVCLAYAWLQLEKGRK